MVIVDSELICHRGATLFAPENTLSSLDKAAEFGGLWIETDVRLTLDGELVMIHDDTLDRTTNGSGFVSLHSLSEIQALDAGSWFKPEFTGECVPKMSEYIECVLDHGLGLQLELKSMFGQEDRLASAVIKQIKPYLSALKHKFYFSSFSERCLRHLNNAYPSIPLALALTVVPLNLDTIAKQTAASIIHVNDDFLDDNNLKRISQSKVEIAVATINSRSRAKYLLDNGVQSVLSDNPKLLAS